MSDRNRSDDEDELWDDIEEFAEAEPDSVDEFAGADDEVAGAEPDSDAEFIEVEEVTDVDSTAGSPGQPRFGDRDSTPVDEGSARGDATPEADEVFDEMDVSAVDGEALWDELADSETDAASFGANTADTAAGTAEAEPSGPTDAASGKPSVGTESERSTGGGATETLVDKRAYCQQCPYFSAPPEVSCAHAGTEIVEVLEDGRFRVRDCPVVTDTGPDRTILNDGP